VRRRVLVDLVDQADARADLAVVGVALHLFPAQAVIERELVGDLPLVLRVDAVIVSADGVIVVDRERPLVRIAAAVDAIDVAEIVRARALRVGGDAEAHGVVRRGLPREVGLHAVGEVVLLDRGGDAVVVEVAVDVGIELHRAVAVHLRDLQRPVIEILLVGDEPEVRLLVLRFVQAGGIDGVGRRIAGSAGVRVEIESRLLVRRVGDLIIRVLAAEEEGQPSPAVELVRDVGHAAILVRLVVDCGGVRRRIFQPHVVMQVAAGKIEVGAVRGSAVGKGWVHCLIAAAVHSHRAAVQAGAAFRRDLHGAVIALGIIGRQRAHLRRHALHVARVDVLREAVDARRQQRAVDIIAIVGILVAEVDGAVGVVGDARRVGQDLVERCVLALRDLVDLLVGDGVGVRADGRVDSFADRCRLGLPENFDGRKLRDVRSGRWLCLR